MMSFEQFGDVRVVLYDGVPRFGYDLQTDPPTLLSAEDTVNRLHTFSSNVALDDGNLEAADRAETLAAGMA